METLVSDKLKIAAGSAVAGGVALLGLIKRQRELARLRAEWASYDHEQLFNYDGLVDWELRAQKD